MSDDIRRDPEMVIARGRRAQALMGDPLLKEALTTIRDSVRDSFFNLSIEARDQREFLHLMDRARQQFENVLLLLINDAEVAQNELTAEEHTAARVEAIQRRTLNG